MKKNSFILLIPIIAVALLKPGMLLATNATVVYQDFSNETYPTYKIYLYCLIQIATFSFKDLLTDLVSIFLSNHSSYNPIF